MTSLRDVATVRVSETVNGRRRGRGPDRGQRAALTRDERVDPLVLAEAQRLLGPGQRLVVVSASEVRLVNRG